MPENVDPTLCTHLIYAFAKMNGNHLAPFEWNDESTSWSKGMYERFNNLKQQNPALKTLLAVGGWNMGSAPFTKMVATDAGRREFATSTVQFLKKNGFDGLDVDWEYPANRGSPAADKDRYVQLLKVLHETFASEGLMLTVAVAAGKNTIDSAYDIPAISQYVDEINLMTYDMHGGSWEDQTAPNAPLKSHPKETGNQTTLNVEWAVNYWLQKGAPAEKINVGMPLYGRSFTLGSRSNNALFSPDRGNGGQAGRYTGEAGFLAYYEICDMLKNGGTRHWIPEMEVPYVVKGDQWVGYDDPQSLKLKVDFVKSKGIGGVMVWALDLDDFSGSCGQGKYPLLRAINQELKSAQTVAPPSVPTTAATTTQNSHGNNNPNNPAQSSNSATRRVCYYTNWSQYRNNPAKFMPENVDPTLCTHLIYAFAKMNGNHLAPFEWNDESTSWSKGMYERFNNLKQQNPALKTLLAVGGWNMGSAPFTQMVATDAGRREFATSTVQFLKKNGFDGLDVDWEYPANRGSPAADKDRYTELLKVLHETFASEGLLLTVAVAAGKSKIDTAYDIPAISQYVDEINLMTYDMHGGSWEDQTAPNAPLKSHPKETGNQTTLNVEWAVNYWLQKGAPPEKINVGMPLYGRSFTLASRSNDGLFAPDRGNGGQAGRYTGEAGMLSYYEICPMLKNGGGGTRHWIPEMEVPYIVKGDQWITYDDKESLKHKVDFVKSKGLGGVMVWSLDMDDFNNVCGEGKYPLLHAINDDLNSSEQQSTTSSATAVPTMQPTTSTPTTAVPTMQPTTSTTTIQPTTPTPATAFPTMQPTTSTPATAVPTMQPTTSTTTMRPTTPTPATAVPTMQPTTSTPATAVPTMGPTTSTPASTTKSTTSTTTTQSPQPTQKPQTQTTHAHTNTPMVPSKTTTTPTKTTHHVGSTNRFDCTSKMSGFYADPNSCTQYFICAGTQSFEVSCASGLLFNAATKFCDWPSKVQCNAPNQGQQMSTQSSLQTNPPRTTHSQGTHHVTTTTTQAPQTTTTTTKAPQTTTTTTTTTQAPVQTNSGADPRLFCQNRSDGHYRDPTDCNKFYQCASHVAYHQFCPPGTAFNIAIVNCDYAYNVPGC